MCLWSAPDMPAMSMQDCPPPGILENWKIEKKILIIYIFVCIFEGSPLLHHSDTLGVFVWVCVHTLRPCPHGNDFCVKTQKSCPNILLETRLQGEKGKNAPLRFHVRIREAARYANNDVIGPPTRWATLDFYLIWFCLIWFVFKKIYFCSYTAPC